MASNLFSPNSKDNSHSKSTKEPTTYVEIYALSKYAKNTTISKTEVEKFKKIQGKDSHFQKS